MFDWTSIHQDPIRSLKNWPITDHKWKPLLTPGWFARVVSHTGQRSGAHEDTKSSGLRRTLFFSWRCIFCSRLYHPWVLYVLAYVYDDRSPLIHATKSNSRRYICLRVQWVPFGESHRTSVTCVTNFLSFNEYSLFTRKQDCESTWSVLYALLCSCSLVSYFSLFDYTTSLSTWLVVSNSFIGSHSLASHSLTHLYSYSLIGSHSRSLTHGLALTRPQYTRSLAFHSLIHSHSTHSHLCSHTRILTHSSARTHSYYTRSLAF